MLTIRTFVIYFHFNVIYKRNTMDTTLISLSVRILKRKLESQLSTSYKTDLLKFYISMLCHKSFQGTM